MTNKLPQDETSDLPNPLEIEASPDASLVDHHELANTTASTALNLASDSPDLEPLAADAQIDPSEVLAEFEQYDAVESETIGEHAEVRDQSLSDSTTTDELDGDETPLATPKERLLAELRLEAKIEAILFASQKPLKIQEILEILHDPEVKEKDLEATLNQLVEFYERHCGGFKLHYLKRLGFQFQTAQEAGHIMERMFASRPRPISRAALETLSIIAYRQPVTRAEVEFIRGVDAGSIFKTLLERELIKCVGRKEIVGRPMMFGTTDEFLKVFNLSSIKDLPPLEAFQPSREMVKGALEKLEEGESPIDVEEYIAESTAAEYESVAAGDDWDESVLDESIVDRHTDTTRLQGATAKGPDDEDLSDIPMEESPESDNGTDPHSEMVIPNGPSFTPGGGELD